MSAKIEFSLPLRTFPRHGKIKIAEHFKTRLIESHIKSYFEIFFIIEDVQILIKQIQIYTYRICSTFEP